MTQQKHTPGPWIVSGCHVYGPTDPRSKHTNGRVLVGGVHTNGRVLVGGVVDDATDWKHIQPCGFQERREIAEEAQANARLIAAAPQMLEALEKLLLQAEATPYSGPYNYALVEAIGAARSAIAAARGVEHPRSFASDPTLPEKTNDPV